MSDELGIYLSVDVFGAIVDKVKVTLITDQKEIDKRIGYARKIYDERNRRLAENR